MVGDVSTQKERNVEMERILVDWSPHYLLLHNCYIFQHAKIPVSNSHLFLHSHTINTNIIHDWTSKWALKRYPTLDTKWTLNWNWVRSGEFWEELFFSKKLMITYDTQNLSSVYGRGGENWTLTRYWTTNNIGNLYKIIWLQYLLQTCIEPPYLTKCDWNES